MEPVIIGSREPKLELTCVERRNGNVEIVGAVGIHELASQGATPSALELPP